jgi:hypothetical protein
MRHMDGPEATRAPAPVGTPQFSAFIARYRIDMILLKRHFMRLGLGLFVSLIVTAYNAFHAHADSDLHLRSLTAEWLIIIHLVLCLLAVLVVGWRLRADLRRHAATLRERVMQVVDFVHRWGNLLLFLAATGHIVLVFGTLIGLDVFSREGRILLATLAPTLLLMIHGVTQIPTRDRLCSIHDATADASAPR